MCFFFFFSSKFHWCMIGVGASLSGSGPAGFTQQWAPPINSLGLRIFLAHVSNVCIKIPEKIAMFGKRKKKKRLHDPHELLQFLHNAGKVFANLKIHYKMSLFYRRSCS